MNHIITCKGIIPTTERICRSHHIIYYFCKVQDRQDVGQKHTSLLWIQNPEDPLQNASVITIQKEPKTELPNIQKNLEISDFSTLK